MKMIKLMFVMALSFGLTVNLSAQDKQDSDFGIWDDNQDGLIDNDEFEAGFEDEGLFGSYDENEDGILDNDEWSTALEEDDFLENDYFDSWDSDDDGYVYENEFYDGAYDTWDDDDNDLIDTNEYEENAEWTR